MSLSAKELDKLERKNNVTPRKNKKEPMVDNVQTNTETNNTTTNTNPATTTPNVETTATTHQTPAGSNSEPITAKTNNGFNPYKGKVINRSYSTPVIDPSLTGVEIPEANYGPAKVESAMSAADELKKNMNANPNQTPLHQQMQQQTGFNALPTPEQNAAASLTADLILEGYDLAHIAARNFTKMPKEKLEEMHRENKINIGVLMIAPTAENPEGGTLLDVVEQINDTVEKTIVVSEEFKTKVRPPLERLCAKYGLGTGDAVYVAGLFIKDAGQKAMVCFGIKKSINQLIAHQSKQYVDIYNEAQKLVQLENEKKEAMLRAETAKQNAEADAAERALQKKRAADEYAAEKANKKNKIDLTDKSKKPTKSTLASSEESAVS